MIATRSPRARLACALLALALCGNVQAAPDAGTTLAPGDRVSVPFAGAGAIEFMLDTHEPVLVRIGNMGRDSILSVYDAAGTRLLRAGGWRGPEHYYHAYFEPAGTAPYRLVLEPDDTVSPPGRLEIHIRDIEADSPIALAERAMTAGADLNLQHYYGDGDTREAALAKYQDAARHFAAAGDGARQADALFEAANVSDVLCRRDITHDQFHAATDIWRRLDDERSLAAVENQHGVVYWATGDSAAATPLFEQAAARRKALGDDFQYAEAINNLGLVHRETGDARLAAQYFLEALSIWQGDVDALADPIDVDTWIAKPSPPYLRQTLIALNNLGYASDVFGDVRQTEQTWRRALELTGHLSNDFTAATLRTNLGNLQRRSGSMEQAMQLFGSALAYFTETSPDEYWASQVYFNIGQLYRDLGDSTRALEYFRRSLEMRAADCDPVGRANTLKEIAALELVNGNAGAALERAAAARLLLAELPGNTATEARLRQIEGSALLSSGLAAEAIERFDSAIALYRNAGDRYGELKARTDRARANGEMGRYFAAIPELRTALDLAIQVDSSLEQFRVLGTLGEIHLENDEPEAALRLATEAIELSESVRQRLVAPQLLRDFAAVQRQAVDVKVAAYLELGDIERAWAASDNGRARRFSELVRQGDIDLSLLDAEERQRYEYLLTAIAQRAEARTARLARNDATAADRIRRELLPLIDELDALQTQARRIGDDRSATADLPTLRRYLGATEIVLEYHVGRSAAGVWVIDEDSIEFSPIPPIEALTTTISATVIAVRRRQADAAQKLDRLARELLPPGALKAAAGSNLLIVPDGPLNYLPFAALPDPAADWEDLLVASRTVRYIPSLHVLPQLSNRASAGNESIAILADPIFNPHDPRVSRREAPATETMQLAAIGDGVYRSVGQGSVDDMPRLPSTRAEADAIEAAAGKRDVLVLYGADANREVVLSGKLQPYGILHFATHGVLDDAEPALSGIVLSGVTASGDRRNSFLRTQDIVGLNLDAQLVVLSGCETGLGRAVEGEGLLSLSRAFFQAGAEQVISTLWQVPDTATAELMRHFYLALLESDATAPEALRSAQLAIRNERRWADPFYWAPFVLQGNGT